MAAVFESIQSPSPDSKISLEDFVDKAKEEACHIETNSKGIFVGGDKNVVAYPHVHVWENGTIALSVASGRNTKIGKNGEIDINLLRDACNRFLLPACNLNNTIRWVLCSAS